MGKKKAVKLGINLGQYPNGGGVSQSQPFYTQKMGIFQEKIICLEYPKMQNKHQKKF